MSNVPRSRVHRGARAAVLAACMLAAAAVAIAQPTPARLKARTGYAPKDFTVFQEGAWFHAFYIETDNSIYQDLGTRLGHSRSKDLYHWEYLDSNFGPGSASFDNDRVWAPHVVKVDNVFYLFYTGISHDAATPGHQSIGVATSTDLSTWNRLSSPIVDCSIADISQCLPNVNWGGQLRDPFAMKDPANSNRWLTYYGTVADGGAYMTAGIAERTGAATTTPWSDHAPVWVPESTWWKNQGKVESPHVFEHAGLWYLLFTSDAGNNHISVLTNAQAPVDAEASWQFRGRIHDVVGATYPYWFASEYFRDTAGREYFGVVSDDTTRALEFRQMNWTPGDWKFALASPFRVSSLVWTPGGGQVTEGDVSDFRIDAWSPTGRQAELEVIEIDSGQPDQVLAPGALGIPNTVNLSGASTTVPWTAQFEPDDDSTPTRLEIRIRVAGEPSIRTPLRYIQQQSGGDHDPYLDGARARQTSGDAEGPATAASAPTPTAEPRLRVLGESPLGGGIALLVDLPENLQGRLELFDIGGRRVREFAAGVLPKGATVQLWDGRDEAGARAGAGIYFAKLTTPGAARVVRVVLASAAR